MFRQITTRRKPAFAYTVYMVTVGALDAYETVTVAESRDAARQIAEQINDRLALSGAYCISHRARVEEVSFHPAGSPA